MMPSRRIVLHGTGLSVVIASLFLFRLWQPEEQVRKHSTHLTDAIAHKDWAKFASLIAEDYHDQWGFDRAAVLASTREVFQRLRDVRISAIGPNVRAKNRVGYWRAFVVIDGSGDAEAIAMVKARVNGLPTPFELEWHQVSGKPWDWQLVAVGNPELNVSPQY